MLGGRKKRKSRVAEAFSPSAIVHSRTARGSALRDFTIGRVAQVFGVSFRVPHPLAVGEDSVLPCIRIVQIPIAAIAGVGYKPGGSQVIKVAESWHVGKLGFIPRFVDHI